MKKKTWRQFIQDIMDEINRTAPNRPKQKDDIHDLPWDEFIKRTRYDIDHDDKELLLRIDKLEQLNNELSEQLTGLETENRTLKEQLEVLKVGNTTPDTAEIISAEIEFPIKDKVLAQKMVNKMMVLLKRCNNSNIPGYSVLKELIDSSLHVFVEASFERKEDSSQTIMTFNGPVGQVIANVEKNTSENERT